MIQLGRLHLVVKGVPAGTEWPMMAETEAALTLLQNDDARSVRDEAWATAGTDPRPITRTVKMRARLREEGRAPRAGKSEWVMPCIGTP